MPDLDVVAWIHVDAGRLLAVRSGARDLLYLPGGKREPGEDDAAAVSREVREELDVSLDRSTIRLLGTVREPAHDQPAFSHVRMACLTARHRGVLRPQAEITELRYVPPEDARLLAPASRAALRLALAHGLLRP
ncbi:NUDIX hydrolase [Actinomadura flavalba]|uniref:NUDIX hydrolase n=1 Tax=Actinomadura flavalba TaxID=1120938 RepID=UPI0003768D39|nr:NUDIX domain-containing protein [Actinomadura flavalba]